MVKFKFTEQPGIYVVLLLFALLIYLLNLGFFKDETLESTVNVLIILIIVSFIIYSSFKTKLKINNIHKNTVKALGVALLMILFVFLFSAIIGAIFGYTHSIMEANSIAMIGSIPNFILFNHKFLTFFVFFLLIPVPETIVAVNIYDLMLSATKSTYTLNDFKVWVSAVLVGIGSIFYHIYAKFIPFTGELNVHALLIVFTLFTLTCIFAVKMREMESVIYAHMGNNGVALYPILKGAFNFMPK